MTYTPGINLSEDVTIKATDILDSKIIHEANFKASKGKSLTGHARDLEWGKALDSVLVVASNGSNVYHAYSGKDGNFDLIVPVAGNYDVYMEKEGFLLTSNKYKVKEQDETVFKRNNLYPEVFTMDPRFMDIFEDMCHHPATNKGLSANFFFDDDDTSKYVIYINRMTDELTYYPKVEDEWVEAVKYGIWKDTLLTNGLVTKKRFIFEEINSVGEVDKSKPYAHVHFQDDQNSGRGYAIDNNTGIMTGLGINVMPGLNPDINKQIENIIHASNIEFLSGYIRDPFMGDEFPDVSDMPDKQSYFGYNTGAKIFTPLDTILMRARFDQLHNVNSYGNHPVLNYQKLSAPIKSQLKSAVQITTPVSAIKQDNIEFQ
jgi:hypothetical protein